MITTIVLNPAVDKIYFVENFQPGKLYRVGNVMKSAGGKGINVARVASIIGEEITVLGFKAGESGRWLEEQTRSLGVKTGFIAVKGETRTNNNIIDTVSGIETEVLEAGPVITGEDIQEFTGLFDETLKKTELLVCSGGLPEGIPDDFYGVLIKKAGCCDVKTILDTSSSPLVEGIKAKPYMVKPNLRELSRYAGRELVTLAGIEEACRDIVAEGVEVVVASLGSQGALLVTREESIMAAPPAVEAKNTIGSGDSMVAGLAAGLVRRYGMEEMLRLGMACAAANAEYMEIGFADKESVDKYYSEVKTRRITGG